MTVAGLRVPRSVVAHSIEEAQSAVAKVGLPFIVRPAFTLGGNGGGVVIDERNLTEVVGRGLAASRRHVRLTHVGPRSLERNG